MRVSATGIVQPERAGVWFDPILWEGEGGNRFTVSCDASQLVISAELPAVRDRVEAFIVLKQVADAAVSAFGFAHGTGYSVELVQVIEEDGRAHVFGVRPGNIAFAPPEPVFLAARELARRDVFFRMALRDYMTAIKETLDCAFFCYRAIEAIEASFAGGTGGNGWGAMHAALGTTRERIQSVVQDFADPVRQGTGSR